MIKILILFTTILIGQADHIIFTEVVLTPSDGEFVTISNPTDEAIDLSNYYLTDATDASFNKYYYNLPSGENFWSGSGSDFIGRFPSGYTLEAGASINISLRSSDKYISTYGQSPDLSLDSDFLDAIDGVSTRGNSGAPKLANTSESLILFFWDGASPTVKDVEYLLWGDNSFAINKSAIDGYQPDIPVVDQSFTTSHETGQKLVRTETLSEGLEIQVGGNGITGHNETSEPFSDTWIVASLLSSKPEISNLSLSPLNPNIGDSLKFEVDVVDDDGISSVILRYEFQQEITSLPMSLSDNSSSLYTAQVDPFGSTGLLIYSVVAEDIIGLKDSTSRIAVDIVEESEEPEEPPCEQDISIDCYMNNFKFYLEKTIQFNGIITVPANLLRTDRTQLYIQDVSDRGILIESPISGGSLSRGDSVSVSGVLSGYLNTTTGDYQPQISNADINFISSNATIPIVDLGSVGSIYKFNDFIKYDIDETTQVEILKYMNTYVKIAGKVVSKSGNVGGGVNIDLQDEEGAFTTVRIWNSTNILLDSDGLLVANEEVDSLTNIGNNIEVLGIGGQYRQSSQVMPAFSFDILEKLEGQLGDFDVSLIVEPYPFVPQLGERIKFEYSFPSNSRIKLRVFDINGRLITTLYDQYRSVSFLKEDVYWDGRDYLNRLVPSGTYLLHLDVIVTTTGVSYQKIAPIVIATHEN